MERKEESKTEAEVNEGNSSSSNVSQLAQQQLGPIDPTASQHDRAIQQQETQHRLQPAFHALAQAQVPAQGQAQEARPVNEVGEQVQQGLQDESSSSLPVRQPIAPPLLLANMLASQLANYGTQISGTAILNLIDQALGGNIVALVNPVTETDTSEQTSNEAAATSTKRSESAPTRDAALRDESASPTGNEANSTATSMGAAENRDTAAARTSENAAANPPRKKLRIDKKNLEELDRQMKLENPTAVSQFACASTANRLGLSEIKVHQNQPDGSFTTLTNSQSVSTQDNSRSSSNICVTNVAASSAQNNATDNEQDENDQEQPIIIPCKARFMPEDHNCTTAYFVVPKDVEHGQDLICSYLACQKGGAKFRYCKYCKIPAAKRNFRQRHLHLDLQEMAGTNNAARAPPIDHARESQAGGIPSQVLAQVAVSEAGMKPRARSSSDSDSASIAADGSDSKLPKSNNRREAWESLLVKRPRDDRADLMSRWLLNVMEVSSHRGGRGGGVEENNNNSSLTTGSSTNDSSNLSSSDTRGSQQTPHNDSSTDSHTTSGASGIRRTRNGKNEGSSSTNDFSSSDANDSTNGSSSDTGEAHTQDDDDSPPKRSGRFHSSDSRENGDASLTDGSAGSTSGRESSGSSSNNSKEENPENRFATNGPTGDASCTSQNNRTSSNNRTSFFLERTTNSNGVKHEYNEDTSSDSHASSAKNDGPLSTNESASTSDANDSSSGSDTGEACTTYNDSSNRAGPARSSVTWTDNNREESEFPSTNEASENDRKNSCSEKCSNQASSASPDKSFSSAAAVEGTTTSRSKENNSSLKRKMDV